MATDINEQVANAYNAAKQALSDDLKQNFYNAAQARMNAFRQINNNANANHALFSGAPTGMQMQYDAGTYLPGLATAATAAVKKQEENQDTWDQYMDYVNSLNEQANYYNNAAKNAQQGASTYTNAVAGFKEKPTTNTTQNHMSTFSNGQGGGSW